MLDDGFTRLAINKYLPLIWLGQLFPSVFQYCCMISIAPAVYLQPPPARIPTKKSDKYHETWTIIVLLPNFNCLAKLILVNTWMVTIMHIPSQLNSLSYFFQERVFLDFLQCATSSAWYWWQGQPPLVVNNWHTKQLAWGLINVTHSTTKEATITKHC